MVEPGIGSLRQRELSTPSKIPSLLYGLGLGGFLDGIVMHQVLQWHHFVSGVDGYPTDDLDGLEANTLADGLFHAASLALLVVSMILVLRHWRTGRIAPSSSYHLGLVVAGIGGFNLVDSVVNHWLLGTHHVRDDLGAPTSWDVGFFILALGLTVAGWALHRRGLR